MHVATHMGCADITNKYREEMMSKMMSENKQQQEWRAAGHGKLVCSPLSVPDACCLNGPAL